MFRHWPAMPSLSSASLMAVVSSFDARTDVVVGHFFNIVS